MILTPYTIAHNLIGVHEVPGAKSHPLIEWMLSLCSPDGMHSDETPWCSAFVNGVAELCGCARSRSLAARSWLKIGTPVDITLARVGWDVVILSRPPNEWAGHVGFFAAIDSTTVAVLAGNQSDEVNIQRFPLDRVLGVRRIGT